MTLGALSRYRRRLDSFTRADHFGANVAHEDLLTAALRYKAAEDVHLYPPALGANPTENCGENSAIELLREFGQQRVQFRTATELAGLSGGSDYIFLVGGPDIVHIGQVRNSLPLARFPVCAVMHAVNWERRDLSYLGLLLLAEPWDVLVSTSRAGEQALQVSLETGREFLKQRLGVCSSIADTLGPRIHRIPLAVDEQFLSPRDPHLSKQALGLPQDKLVFLYLGRLTEHYKADLEPLLIAHRRVLEQEPRAILVLAGQDLEGDYSRKLRVLGDRLGLGANLRVITNFQYSLKPLLYSASDAFVSPVDNVQETFGLSILEAMASALPVIASDWSGYRDLVLHGETGFLVPTLWSAAAADTVSAFEPMLSPSYAEHYLAQGTVLDTEVLYTRMLELAKSQDLRTSLGRAGRARVQSEFCWRCIAGAYGDLWQDQVARRDQTVAPLSKPKLTGFNQIFQHYATEGLDTQRLVKLGELARAGVGIERIQALKSSPFKSEVVRILGACQKQALSFEEIVNGNDSQSLDAALWVIKKGYCTMM